MEGEKLDFRLRKLFAQQVLDRGLKMNADRLRMMIEDHTGDTMIRMLLAVATQEDQVHDDPVNLLTKLGKRWQKTKEKSRLLQRFFPLKYDRVWAVHKYPEVLVPEELLGREFVSFRVERIL